MTLTGRVLTAKGHKPVGVKDTTRESFYLYGSVDGAVRLVDAANGHLYEFKTVPGARVQWLEFSVDDRTLAGIDENGQLWTWDVATGTPRSAPLHLLHGDVFAARIRYNGDTLFGEGLGLTEAEFGYVTLAPRAVFNNEAVPGVTSMPVPK